MSAWWANDEQNDWMRYLASLPPEKKCKCGWNRRGECFNCKPEDGGRPQGGDADDR